ncbi:PepSY-like domain-containing protein [uncultured Empedobacter sp.]|uniref:PepSY-like domain-containing protein n=1 Tax=Empedobacter stercoris TaxID=1628248 RepID=UPI00263144C7|nr:PepSY-like domain-containing protein [uncultured Empedobacter sp.]
MKKLFLGTALFTMFALVTTSCNNDDDTTTTETVELKTLPEEGRSFVTTYFSGIEIARIEKHSPAKIDGTMYEVDFVNRDEIDFDQNGTWLKVEAEGNRSIPTGFILPSIVSYINTNYPTLKINQIEKTYEGFEVELTNDLDLIFNASGEFIRVQP